jgi:hypothetical protein
VESIARSESRRKLKGPMRLPAGDFEKHYALNSVNSRARYHEQRLAVQRSHTTAASKDNRQDSTQ